MSNQKFAANQILDQHKESSFAIVNKASQGGNISCRDTSNQLKANNIHIETNNSQNKERNNVIKAIEAVRIEMMKSAMDGTQNWICDMCKSYHSGYSNAKLHFVEIHRDTNFYPCDECEELIGNRRALKRHIKEKHSINEYG